jgi:hypothetical protein
VQLSSFGGWLALGLLPLQAKGDQLLTAAIKQPSTAQIG